VTARQWYVRQYAGILMASLLAGGTGVRAEGEPAAPAAKQETAPMIQDNATVQLEYTLTSDGVVVDSTEGRGPFQYVHGKSQIIPGLERQLTGLHVGDSRDITVKPEEAYGPMDPAALIEVPNAQLPQDIAPKAGMMLRGQDPAGHPFRATIRDVKENTVLLDLNHPLAGKTLLFKVKIVNIAPAKAG